MNSRSFGEELQSQMDRISLAGIENDDELNDLQIASFSKDILRRKSVYQAWTHLTSNLVNLNLLSLAPER